MPSTICTYLWSFIKCSGWAMPTLLLIDINLQFLGSLILMDFMYRVIFRFPQNFMLLWLYPYIMTQVLAHTVAFSTNSSFRPKINNQSIKKFLSLAVIWVKIVKVSKILTFKINFLCQKWSESLSIFFSLKNINLGACFLLLTFFENFYF